MLLLNLVALLIVVGVTFRLVNRHIPVSSSIKAGPLGDVTESRIGC